VNDTTLEELLTTAGASYELPDEAFARVLQAAGESAAPAARRRRLDHPRLVAAGVLLVAAVGGTFLGSGHTGGGATTATVAGSAGADTVKGHGDLAPRSTGGGSATRTTDSLGSVYGTSESAGGTGQKVVNGPSVPLTATGQKADAASDAAKIVHTGTLALTVAKGQVTATLTRVTGLATGVGGYVSSSTTAEAGSKPSGTVVLRVPADSYDTVLTQARTLGTVASTTSAAQDVTAQAADQHARLTALKASRDQFLTILAKAKTIGETLAVQQRVDDAQAQIDQLQGQINVLASQASYGTLTVTVSQKSPAVVATKPTPRQNGLSKAWHRAVNGFVTGVEALVARSGRALLVLLVLLVAAGLLRGAWRLGRRRFV
jgi:hypothetical protein